MFQFVIAQLFCEKGYLGNEGVKIFDYSIGFQAAVFFKRVKNKVEDRITQPKDRSFRIDK